MKGIYSVLPWKKRILSASIVFLLTAFQAWGAASDYYGTYAGTFTGDDSGYWVAAISSSESVFLSYSSSGDGDGGNLYYSGETETAGRFYSYSIMNNSEINAYIYASTGAVSGTWENTYMDGTFSGYAVSSSEFSGTYSGNIKGDASGTWSMTIEDNGYLSGSVEVEEGTMYFNGGVHPDGYVMGVGDDFTIFGSISGSKISGSWLTEDGYSGTFSTGGGGSSSGGCFIDSILPR